MSINCVGFYKSIFLKKTYKKNCFAKRVLKLKSKKKKTVSVVNMSCTKQLDPITVAS
jgi:hypothetical protein